MIAISQQFEKTINLNESGLPVNLPDCYTRITEITCYKTESCGSTPNHALEKWLELSSSLCTEYATKHKLSYSWLDNGWE